MLRAAAPGSRLLPTHPQRTFTSNPVPMSGTPLPPALCCKGAAEGFARYSEPTRRHCSQMAFHGALAAVHRFQLCLWTLRRKSEVIVVGGWREPGDLPPPRWIGLSASTPCGIAQTVPDERSSAVAAVEYARLCPQPDNGVRTPVAILLRRPCTSNGTIPTLKGPVDHPNLGDSYELNTPGRDLPTARSSFAANVPCCIRAAFRTARQKQPAAQIARPMQIAAVSTMVTTEAPCTPGPRVALRIALQRRVS
jgi:hypothetical protein